MLYLFECKQHCGVLSKVRPKVEIFNEVPKGTNTLFVATDGHKYSSAPKTVVDLIISIEARTVHQGTCKLLLHVGCTAASWGSTIHCIGLSAEPCLHRKHI